jgi:prophage regulatory protein
MFAAEAKVLLMDSIVGLQAGPHADGPFPGSRLLPFVRVRERVGISRTSIYGLISTGDFPRPVKVGRASRWLSGEIDGWVNSLVEARDGQRAA